MGKENYQYSAQDIQRYLKGQMSPEEMHAMETAALDDPFLADAIEGFELALQNEDESINEGLGRLDERFTHRIKRPATVVKMPRSTWWQISAAAMILLIVGVALYNNWADSEETENPSLAVTKKSQHDSLPSQAPQTEQSSSLSALSDSQELKTGPASSESSRPPSTSNKPPAKTKLTDGSQRDIAGTGYHNPADDQQAVPRQNVEDAAPAKKENVKPPATASPQGTEKESYPQTGEEENLKRARAANQLNNFSGRVLDANNKPLPNASLQVMQNRTSVMTDENGNFNFMAKDSIVDVQVGLVGFEQRNFRLQNNVASNNIVLEPNREALNEVVIVGYGTQRKKDLSKTTGKVQNAVPVVGWVEYEKYIEKNKWLPANNPSMKGDVVVSFDVKKSAALSNFKVEQSLSKEYDAEALRLIKEGPAWTVINGRKTRVTVIVKF